MKNSSNVIGLSRRAQGARRNSESRRLEEGCNDNVIHIGPVMAAREALPAERDVDQVVELLALLANPTRLKLVLALLASEERTKPELCVCDLAAVAGASESMTSHQLRLLREAGLVGFRRDGKLALYHLVTGPHRHLLADALDYVRAR